MPKKPAPLSVRPDPVVRIGRPKVNAGGWYNSAGQRRAAMSARERLGYSHAAVTSSIYETPTSHYSFYRQYRSLMPAQYWQLYKTTPDVRACVDSIVRRIATWDWYVKPMIDPRDSEGFAESAEIAERARQFLAVPNKNGTTWQEMMTALVTDLLVYDAGAMELVKDPDGSLSELVVWLGSEWFPVTDKHGRLLRYEQDTENDEFQPVALEPADLAYFQLFRNTRSNLGLPVLESIINECVATILADEHAMLALDADEIPPGLLVLGGVAGPAAERARSDLQAMRGKDHSIRVVTSPQPQGIEAKWVELRHTLKDLELRDVVDVMRHTIWRVFGVTPVELGETSGIPRASAEVQMDVASSHLITPILELLQARINAQIMPALLGEDAKKVRFSFDRTAPATAKERLDDAKRAETLLKNGVMTINEVRSEMGMLPIDGGDQPLLYTSVGPLPLSSIASGGAAEAIGNDAPSNLIAEEDVRLDLSRGKLDEVSEKVRKALKKKAKEHNEEVQASYKKTSAETLAKVFVRGVGAYHTNPGSVRPSVNSAEQWAFARVNSFIYALKNEKFRSGKHDTDLFPSGHPLKSDGEEKTEDDRAKYDQINFSPPKACREEAARGLEWYEEGHGGAGLVPATIRWARKLARGEDITPEKARKMRAWLARHEVDKKGEGFNPGEKGYPSPGRVAWALWCGDPGVSWSNKLVRQMDAADEKEQPVDRSVAAHKHTEHGHGCSCCEKLERDVERWPNTRDWKEQLSQRSVQEWLPSHWANPNKFKGLRTLDLEMLAEIVARYSKEAADLYVETAEEVRAIVSGAYGSSGTLGTLESTEAIRRIDDAFDALLVKWRFRTAPLYQEATELGKSDAAKWMGMEPLFDAQLSALNYQNEAMAWLSDANGLVGTLRSQIRQIVEAAALDQRSRADKVDPGMDPDDVLDIIDAEFSAQSYRIENWSGKLVFLSTAAAIDSTESLVVLGAAPVPTGVTIPAPTAEEAAEPTVWFYEWVAFAGRNCETCIVEGAEGYRPLADASILPGQGTVCGARCRCVLVFWTEREIRGGYATRLSELPLKDGGL